MIEKNVYFVNSEYETFHEDFKISNLNLRLLTTFTSSINDVNINTLFIMGKPKFKFKPKVETFKNNNRNNLF